jgi:hypothetical protein
MATNELPTYDMSNSETGCCPRFNPEPWDDLEIRFEEKLFVKGTTRSLFHIPLNMGGMMKKTMASIKDADAFPDSFLLLSRDRSPWRGEHYFAVNGEVPGAEMVRLSGTYLTKTFEGPYKDASRWMRQMQEHVAAKGKSPKKMYFFYTTCPKCVKHYGKNHVVGFAEVA